MFDRFGSSVAIHENTAVVGAYGNDANGSDSGAAYVFVRNGASWAQQAKLTSLGAVPGDYFGFAVAVNGDYALVGAHLSDAAGPDSGVAYLFARNGNTWIQDQQLIPSDISIGDQFGYAVDMVNGAAIIGSPKENRHQEDMGAAYVFVETRDAWAQQAKLTADDSETGDEFGDSSRDSTKIQQSSAHGKTIIHCLIVLQTQRCISTKVPPILSYVMDYLG